MHFDKALASSAPRPFVRGMQISALLWRPDPDLEVEAVRVANDMRIKSEPWAAGAEGRTSGIWDIYYRRLINKNDAEAFLASMPAKDLLDTYVWLLRGYDNSANGVPYRFMLAQLQELTRRPPGRPGQLPGGSHDAQSEGIGHQRSTARRYAEGHPTRAESVGHGPAGASRQGRQAASVTRAVDQAKRRTMTFDTRRDTVSLRNPPQRSWVGSLQPELHRFPRRASQHRLVARRGTALRCRQALERPESSRSKRPDS